MIELHHPVLEKNESATLKQHSSINALSQGATNQIIVQRYIVFLELQATYQRTFGAQDKESYPFQKKGSV